MWCKAWECRILRITNIFCLVGRKPSCHFTHHMSWQVMKESTITVLKRHGLNFYQDSGLFRGRQIVKKLLYECTICRRLRGKSCSPPTAPALTSFRITKEQPYTFTGADFTGHLYVKWCNEMRKTHVSVYTCAVSRAVDLDTVNDLTA